MWCCPAQRIGIVSIFLYGKSCEASDSCGIFAHFGYLIRERRRTVERCESSYHLLWKMCDGTATTFTIKIGDDWSVGKCTLGCFAWNAFQNKMYCVVGVWSVVSSSSSSVLFLSKEGKMAKKESLFSFLMEWIYLQQTEFRSRNTIIGLLAEKKETAHEWRECWWSSFSLENRMNYSWSCNQIEDKYKWFCFERNGKLYMPWDRFAHVYDVDHVLCPFTLCAEIVNENNVGFVWAL